jgi:lipoyl(octanoyl) transferase
MDLSPFKRINPCGYPGLDMVQMIDFNRAVDFDQVASSMCQHLVKQLQYLHVNTTQQPWVGHH